MIRLSEHCDQFWKFVDPSHLILTAGIYKINLSIGDGLILVSRDLKHQYMTPIFNPCELEFDQ